MRGCCEPRGFLLLARLGQETGEGGGWRRGGGRASNSKLDGLPAREAALACWARKVVLDPNATTAEEVQALRTAGLSDREIFEATAFIALRLAFSTVNDALGAQPDRQLVETSPPERAGRDHLRPGAVDVLIGRPPGSIQPRA